MKVIVIGCGKVGKAIVESLSDEGHDVVAIDTHQEIVDYVSNTYDVMAICGSGTSRELLSQAGVANTDLFISATEYDEVNMLACFLAKKMGARRTIARIRKADYNDDGLDYLAQQLDLSMALNPESLTAEMLFDSLKLPSAVNVETFAGKKIQLLELIVHQDSLLNGANIAQMRKDCSVPFIVCAVQRGEQVIIPDGTCVLQHGDKVAFMVKRNETYKFLKSLGLVQKQGKDVLILGASEIAYYLSKLLVANNYSVKIIERDATRCTEIAQMLPNNATVIRGDGMSQDLLLEEGIKTTDSFVALTGKDEDNILISFYALGNQVPKVIAKVSHNQMSALAEKLGLDCVVSPQKIVADVITRYARALNSNAESPVLTVYGLMNGSAEALEFSVVSGDMVGVAIKDLKLKQGCIIAGIIRGKESIIPEGGDVINVGDRVIVIAKDEHIGDLADILR